MRNRTIRDSEKADRGRPWITWLVMVVCAVFAAMLFRQLHDIDSSPEAAGSADQLMIAAHKADGAR